MRSHFRALTFLSLAALTAGGAPGYAAGPPQTEAESPGRVEELRFPSGDISLAGRLWLPDGPGPHPAVAFLPGSGQSIRNLDLDPDPVPFHFVRQGIAFLAWDKRGVRDSEGVFEPLPDSDPEAQLARLRLLASDGAAAMRYLAGRDDIDADRVGAWAFSQGGWVAPLLESVGASPAFVIVVGGPAVTIREENVYSEIAEAARDSSRAGEGRIDMETLYERLAARDDADEDSYDPIPWLETFEAPILYLLGEYDFSVPTARSVERLEEIGRRREWIDYRVFPRANHGVGTQDPAGGWYPAPEFYETQWDFLGNLGILERRFRIETRVRRETR